MTFERCARASSRSSRSCRSRRRRLGVNASTDGTRAQVMEPHTARNLKESKSNKLKDFVQVSGPLGISHFLMLSSSDAHKYLKICRTPRGPTLTFKIHSFSLASEVAAAQRLSLIHI